MKPLVAVTVIKRDMPTHWDPHTPLFSLSAHYVEALRRAGAVPLLLAHPDSEDVDQVLDVADGLLLTGGGDIDPSSYGEVNEGLSRQTDPRADASEIALVRTARERRLPTLGICRGMQVLNVALGGTMHQHIITPEGPHRPEPADFDAVKRHGHQVSLVAGSRLAQLYGRTERFANSYHHQAVNRLGDGLEVTATAPDGIVEAVEYGGSWNCMGVQWHPEKTLEDTDFPLFEAFVRSLTAPGVPAASR